VNIVLATLAMALSAAAPPSTEPPTTAPSSTAPTTTAPNTAPSTTAPIPEGYVPLVDDTNSIVLAVPEAWTDVDTAPKADAEGVQRPYIAASPDLESSASFDTPGVLYAALPFTADPLVLIEQLGLREGCETLEVKTYDDPVFVGAVQIGTNCGPNAMTWNMVVANPVDESFTAVVRVSTANPDELRTILLTFNYPGSTPRDPNATTTTTAATTTTSGPTTTAGPTTTVAG
jgi:hypothetical protein